MPSWTQSPRVKVIVKDGDLLIPRELLRQRSPYFRRAIDEQPHEEGPQTLPLARANLRTLKRFYRWSLSEEPYLHDELTPEELERIAFFAEDYQVFALQHQVADIFNVKFSGKFDRDKLDLEPTMVSRVYQKYGPQSCLRRVFQASLKLVSPGRLLNEWDEWSRLADGGGDLAKDLLKAMVEAQNVQNRNVHWHSLPTRSTEPCGFHDHLRQGLTTELGLRANKEKCPFRVLECFPDDTIKEEVCEGKKRRNKKGKKRIQSEERPVEGLTALEGEPTVDPPPAQYDDEPPQAPYDEEAPQIAYDEPSLAVGDKAPAEFDEAAAVYDEPSPAPEQHLEDWEKADIVDEDDILACH